MHLRQSRPHPERWKNREKEEEKEGERRSRKGKR
jgi:hypothetical protein